MIKVAILGGSGYTGLELLRWLSHHPRTEIVTVTSRRYKRAKVWEVFPSLKGHVALTFQDPEGLNVTNKADLVFSCLPHKDSMEVIPGFIKVGKRVVDLSADFRLKNYRVYEAWYGQHTARGLLKKAIYGLPEVYRTRIKKATLVANPGCYPTGAILGLLPLLKEGLIDPCSIIIDAKSGASGAGRGAILETSFVEVNEGFKAYKVGEHRHTPEIEQELSLLAGLPVKVSFTPYLLPLNRGILTTIYSTLKRPSTTIELLEVYKKTYKGEPFIRLMPEGRFPDISQVRGSNYCDIGFKVDTRTDRVIVITAIDNLVKGASGQAVQNMNIMHGLPEGMGLLYPPLSP